MTSAKPCSFSKNPQSFFFHYLCVLLCRETKRACTERLAEKQRRGKSGQPAAQEKQRDGENAVRTRVWSHRRPQMPSAKKKNQPQ